MLTAITILRFVSLVLACWNLKWTYRGAIDLMHWRWSPPSIYLSVVFWMAIGNVAFFAAWTQSHARPYNAIAETWHLLAYVLQAVSMALAAYGNRLGVAIKARKFYALYEHLEPAFAIAQLDKLDPAAATRIADECRQLSAAIVWERAA